MVERIEERIDIARRKTLDGKYDLARIGWHERCIPAHLPALDLICERQASNDENVGCILVRHLLQQIPNLHN